MEQNTGLPVQFLIFFIFLFIQGVHSPFFEENFSKNNLYEFIQKTDNKEEENRNTILKEEDKGFLSKNLLLFFGLGIIFTLGIYARQHLSKQETHELNF